MRRCRSLPGNCVRRRHAVLPRTNSFASSQANASSMPCATALMAPAALDGVRTYGSQTPCDLESATFGHGAALSCRNVFSTVAQFLATWWKVAPALFLRLASPPCFLVDHGFQFCADQIGDDGGAECVQFPTLIVPNCPT